MSFHERTDPLIEKLQQAIDGLKTDIYDNEFKAILEQIDARFPFVDLSEFLELYVGGEYAKALTENFHLSGYVEYMNLLSVLKLPKKRRSTQKTSQSREINLTNKRMANRYQFLQVVLTKFLPTIKNKIMHNVLRSIVIFYLYSNVDDFTDGGKILHAMPGAIVDFERMIFAPHTSIAIQSKDVIENQTNLILDELKEKDFLEYGDSGKFRLKKHQLEIQDYIFNTIHNREGITYQDLQSIIKVKIPILALMPETLFQISLHELSVNNKIIKKEGYWKFRPSYDEYFTLKHYQKIMAANSRKPRKNQEFFGRKITPEAFIEELKLLDRGDFEDQDDQVTRIAGMILTNSPMMSHPPNELDEFDFVVDLSNYKFTKEQEALIQNLGLEIRSNIIYVKVMTDENLSMDKLSNLSLKLKNRGHGEQGFVISFIAIDSITKRLLNNDKTIQLIAENELKEWCKITPVIPSRRGSVVIVRQGLHRDSIAKINSVNYESGMADMMLLHSMETDVQFIGSLDEITLDVPIEQFTDHSSRYFEFLKKLYQISKNDVFKSVIVEGSTTASHMETMPDVKTTPLQITSLLHGFSKVKIDHKRPNRHSIKYSTNDLFSCTCFSWENMSKTHGLCDHLVLVLNESVKKLLSTNTKLSSRNTRSILNSIEHKMDVYLQRLRYANMDGSDAICPNCGCAAYTLKKVEELFGYRQMSKKDKFSLRRQSQCKKCRAPRYD